MNNDITQAQIEGQKIDEIFYFYDEPKLYSCRLDDGNRYVVFWADEDQEKQIWFYVKVSDPRYHAMLGNEISLRGLFEHSEDGFLYVVTLAKDGRCLIDRLASKKNTSELLPQQDVYLFPRKPRMQL